MRNIDQIHEGSKIDNFSFEKNAYLIRKIGSSEIEGVDASITSDWFYADRGWQALDEAVKFFGNCEVVKSCKATTACPEYQ